MSDIADSRGLDGLLKALGEQLAAVEQGYELEILTRALRHLGVEDADLGA